MTLPEAVGLWLAFVAPLRQGAQGHRQGCPPHAEQRICFANHRSHIDGVLIWAALRADLRAVTRPIAADGHGMRNRFEHWPVERLP